MRDIKSKLNVASDDFWPFMPIVNIPGNKEAQNIPEGATQQQAEAVIKTWQKIAILEVTPDIEVYVGFISGEHSQFLNVTVQKQDGKFGMRLGHQDISFFVIPKDLKSRPTLKLVEIASIDEPKYTDLPLY